MKCGQDADRNATPDATIVRPRNEDKGMQLFDDGLG